MAGAPYIQHQARNGSLRAAIAGTPIASASLFGFLEVPPQIAAVGDGAEMRRADLARILLQRTRQRRCSSARLEGSAPACEFRLIDQQIDAPRLGVDADAIAVLNERDRPAGLCLR